MRGSGSSVCLQCAADAVLSDLNHTFGAVEITPETEPGNQSLAVVVWCPPFIIFIGHCSERDCGAITSIECNQIGITFHLLRALPVIFFQLECFGLECLAPFLDDDLLITSRGLSDSSHSRISKNSKRCSDG